MKSALRLSLRVFFRSWKYIVLYTVLLVITGFFVIRECSSLTVAYTTTTLITVLNVTLRMGIVGFVFFGFVAYEFQSTLRHVEGEECILATEKAVPHIKVSNMIVMLIPLLIWSVFLFMLQIIAYVIKAPSYPQYFIHCGLGIILYFVLPCTLAILLGTVLYKESRPLAYAALVFSALLISEMPLATFGTLKVGELSVASICDFFYITVPNTTWISDGVYGVAMEPRRWWLVGFWMSVFLTIFSLQGPRRKGKNFPYIPIFLTIVTVFFGVRYALGSGDYILQKDSRPDGMLSADQQYWLANGSGEEKAADFSVTAYRMKLTIREFFQGEITIELSDGKPADNLYLFTLHHDMVIDAVTDDKGQALSYERKLDYLDVTAENTDYITVSYHGNLGRYFADNQAVALPGYVAYYPMAGHKVLWDSARLSTLPVTDMNPTEFYVQVDSPLDLLSNMESEHRNEFHGTAQTISLYGGILVEEPWEETQWIHSPIESRTIGFSSAQLESIWQEIKAVLDLEKDYTFQGKLMVLQPITIMMLNSANENVVVFDDHIVFSSFNTTVQAVCTALVEQQMHMAITDEIYHLYDAFVRYLLEDDLEKVEKPSYEDMEILLKPSSELDFSDERVLSEYNTASIGFDRLYYYQVSTLGRETVARKVYHYLNEEYPEENFLDFLYNLDMK